MAEGIQPENNRTFKTGSGNWTGDFTWDGGILGGKQGYIYLTFPLGEPPKNVSLQYPAIKPKINDFNSLTFKAYKILYGIFTIDILVTDGIYSFTKQFIPPSGPGFWDGGYIDLDIPADWNKPTTTLTLTVSVGWMPGLEAKIALDEFSLGYEEVKIQYLPIMGVG